MLDYEQLGVFYLGKHFDPDAGALRDEPVLYPSKQLTTHAVVLGMTGSGKTGLSIAMLEEAAIDGVPAICIDPKGDLGNLLLNFPDLAPADFAPWVDPDEAARKGLTVDAYAEKTAATWRAGLGDWHQDAARIQRLRDAADVTIYTPGSSAGVPLALLRSFAAPRGEVDDETLRERVSAAAAGLLGLIGVDADPLQSREHILVSRILHDAWAAGQDVDLAALIGAIQRPPFTTVGVMDLDGFFPPADRAALALRINNLLASPGAQSWMQGEPLDIAALLTGAGGKPRIAIVSIAHLDDAQRMFFVSTLLSELVTWMRAQRGTSSLRALLFMDEIAGYFPPTANPPSKPPMLTLLKQARAFGLGVVLATQNPVDLDYKGLSNCGTWLIGRLQTERDKARVLDGLEGAAGGGLDRARLDTLLSGLGSRVFLLHSVHAPGPVIFQTRWTLSYLRGPITRDEIKRLTAARAAAVPASPGVLPRAPSPPAAAPAPQRPLVPAGVDERFHGDGVDYTPHVHAKARVHYVDKGLGVDVWEDVSIAAPLVDDDRLVAWSEGDALTDEPAATPNEGASYADLPAQLARKTLAADWRKSVAAWLYQERALELRHCAALDLTSTPGETEDAFRARLAFAARERRDADVEALQRKVQPKIEAAEAKVRKAEQKVAKEQADAQAATVSTVASLGTALFGGLFGRGSVATKVASAARATSRGMAARTDVADAQQDEVEAEAALARLREEIDAELARIAAAAAPEALVLEAVRVPVRKADTAVSSVTLLWRAG